MVRLRFEVDGVVERADLIGAIFGQTEGLFGPEMNLQELQKTWKVGRIEISLDSRNDKTYGEVLIPMSTDVSTAALIAAAVENVDKVGPCTAKFQLISINDVRADKRKVIVERAKGILKDWASKTASEGEESLKDVMESTKRGRVIGFGREDLPAGPGVFNSDTVYIVEGRADVINLMRAGIDNAVAIEGTSIPDSIRDLAKKKKLIAFVDGDRGGDLILKELSQVARVDKVFRAPRGKEVEELTPVEILEILKSEPTAPAQVIPTSNESRTATVSQLQSPLVDKAKEIYPEINGTLEAILFDSEFKEVARTPVNELVGKLQDSNGARYVVFDGIITQRLVDSAQKAGISVVVGHRTGEISSRPTELKIHTFRDLGLE
jgi:DNA primase